MPIHLYNTLTRRKEPLTPRDPPNVRMYVCGPTVYDLAHVGNARPVVVFDVLYRLLRYEFGARHVTYVRNITDVDDKIIAAAKENNESIEAVTARTTKAFHEDIAALGGLPPTHEPRATDHIPQMIAMIEQLIARGHAYAADGHVLFSVPSMPDYGKLSRRNRQEQIDGARVDVAPYKQDPADFVLWKLSTPEQPGWDSPWGRGRPGWHIECSAMAAKCLGEHFDIHGGGQDLIFPHHENELAQSVCAQAAAPTDSGEAFVNIWMHNGFVIANGEKMSKSLGNFFTVRQLLDEGVRGEVLRLVLLSAHYRQPLDITRDKLAEAKSQLNRWYRALEACGEGKPEFPTEDEPGVQRFFDALRDDLNTPQAIVEISQQANLVFHSMTLSPKTRSEIDFAQYKGTLMLMGRLLGLLTHDPDSWFKRVVISPEPATARTGTAGPDVIISSKDRHEAIKELIDHRNAARKAKNFAEADRIRDELAAQGVILEDRPDGTTDWRRA